MFKNSLSKVALCVVGHSAGVNYTEIDRRLGIGMLCLVWIGVVICVGL